MLRWGFPWLPGSAQGYRLTFPCRRKREWMESKMRKGIFMLCCFLFFGSTEWLRGSTPSATSPAKAPEPPVHFPPDRDFDLHEIRLELDVDLKGRKIRGEASLTLQPINDGLDRIVLHAVDLAIEGVTDEKGIPLPFETRPETLIVFPAHPLQAEERITLRITYAASPRKGLYFVGPDEGYPDKPYQVWSQGETLESRYWFPTFDAPSERISSETIITVERPFQVISNGRLLSVEPVGAEKRRFHWKTSVPHPSYLLSIVAGEFEEIRDTYGEIPLLAYLPKGRRAEGERVFKNTARMVAFFSDLLDFPYPYEKYAQVIVYDFLWGGMENISATTLTERILHDEAAALHYDADPLLAHELAHQWWGDLVTCKAWPHLWLNEGFATYFEALWVEHDKGSDHFSEMLTSYADAYLEEAENNGRRPVVTRHYRDPDLLFDAHIYEKGAWVLHMLRQKLGDPRFWKGMRHYLHRHANESVDTDDFMKAIEEATGRNLERFFDEWVFHPGYPEFRVSWSWKEPLAQEANGFVHLIVEQIQDTSSGTPIFHLPLTLSALSGGEVTTWRVEISEARHDFFLPLPKRPDTLLFDPEGSILKTLTFEKSAAEWIVQLRDAPTLSARREAVRALGGFTGASVVGALRETYEAAPFYGLRKEIATALGKIRTGMARDLLLAISRDPEARVRSAAAKALGSFRRDEAVAKRLAELFRDDPSPHVAGAAAEAIGKVAAPGAFDLLVEALSRPAFREVIRNGAFEGMVALGDPRALSHLVAYTRYGQPPDARTGAISALGRFPEKLDHAPEVETARRKARETLCELTRDPDYHARLTAIRALGDLKDPDALETLHQVERSDLHADHREAARRAIRKIETARRAIEGETQLEGELSRLREENDALKRRLAEIEARLGIEKGEIEKGE
ncbi:MAG: hypothetical protein D6795_14470 [Deltaproteobacteria bacterium]|nr:MAG: hypothetical protein D6795_14470 [Deltaproteobacteria bacterium]